MKLFYSIIIVGLFTACSTNSDSSNEELKKETEFTKGKYVRVDHIKIDKVSDAVGGFGLISEITFHNKNCEFDYVGLSMSGSYEVDGNKVFIDAGGQIGKLSMELIDNNKLQGTGFINGIFMNVQSQEYLDYKEKTKDLYYVTKTVVLRSLPINDRKVMVGDTLFEGESVIIKEDKNGWAFIENKQNRKFGYCKRSILEAY